MAAPAFACVVAGRAPAFLSADASNLQHTIEISDVSRVNHLVRRNRRKAHVKVVFATQTLPPEAGAVVFFHFPGQQWKVLGLLHSERPSAIYAVRGQAPAGLSAGGATLGVMVEDRATAESRLPPSSSDAMDIGSGANTPTNAMVLRKEAPDAVAVVTALAKHLLQYLAGFTQQVANPAQPSIVGSYVDITVLEKWGRDVTAKCRNLGVGWLLREQD